MSKFFKSAYSGLERVQSRPEGDSLTEQCFRDECDVNHIMRRFLGGKQPAFAKQQLQFGDFTGVSSYQEACQLSIDAEAEFMRLPADLRLRFANDVGEFLNFYDDEANFDECVKLGLKAAKPVVEPVAQDGV